MVGARGVWGVLQLYSWPPGDYFRAYSSTAAWLVLWLVRCSLFLHDDQRRVSS